jgi:FixJ family two-component response regulator
MRSEAGVPRKPLISVVDDDASVGAAIKGLLKSVGLAAEAFQSAEDFLASRQLHRTSCLITDLNMRGMSGYALHQQLVASGRNIPTILITAYHDDSIREQALRDGVICYLIKPFDENDLLACVRSALDNLRGKYLS